MTATIDPTDPDTSVADDVLDWLIDQHPSVRKKALVRHPETIDVIEKKVQRELADLSPAGLAQYIDPGYKIRPHLEHLDTKLAQAIRKVEAGESVFLRVSEPPRSGKSFLCSQFAPLWILKRHPEWKIGLVSYSDNLASSWGRQVRRFVEDERLGLGISIARDAGAVKDWETTEGGGVSARSIGMGLTGQGFQVLIIDDPVKDYADAHSSTRREALREWWKTTARTRLEPPSLVLVIGTRWHEDDFVGWVGDAGDPFETIEMPAIATENDVLGREPGDPLYSPLLEETREEAIERWAGIREAVGPSAWAALYQQTPHPSEGTVFEPGWWKFWTTDPLKVDDKTILWEPTDAGTWLDSWDLTLTESKASDYTVGQRWVKDSKDRRFLVGQVRGRWAFMSTLEKMREWARPESVNNTGRHVHKRLVERAANGAAIIETLSQELSGIKAIIPRSAKEVRARAVTPEIASGHVYLPHPSDPGNQWVLAFLEEVGTFPSGAHDDQVDPMTQALTELRNSEVGGIGIPGRGQQQSPMRPPLGGGRSTPGRNHFGGGPRIQTPAPRTGR